MDMALDDVIMQEREGKQKVQKQFAKEKAAISKARAKDRRSSGPQRTRDLGRIEVRTQIKPYLRKSAPPTPSLPRGTGRAKSTPLPPFRSKHRPSVTVFSVQNDNVGPVDRKPRTRSVTAPISSRAATVSATPLPSRSVVNTVQRPAAPAPPKRAISILGEGGPATIRVENLHPGATPEDIKTVFARFGTVKNCTALYDQHGRATGRAEICYSLKIQALAAVKALNNVEADGHILRVQLLPTMATPALSGQISPVHPVQKSGPIHTQRTSSGSGSGRLYSDELAQPHSNMDMAPTPVMEDYRHSRAPTNNTQRPLKEPRSSHTSHHQSHGNTSKSSADPIFNVRF